LIKILKNGLLSLFFPTPCAACGRYVKDFTYLYVCPECYKGIKKLDGHLCAVCFKPLNAEYLTTCRECSTEERLFKNVAPAGVYDGALKGMIHHLKFYNKKKLASVLAEFIVENVCGSAIKWADVIVPVPLSRNVLAQRGYNQTALIAQDLAKKYSVEFSEAVLKTKETEPQNKLDRKERLKNLKGVFLVSLPVAGKKVLVVDDVYTTGATMNEMARVLLGAGAMEVRGIMAARSV
jgi:competence protein ComFC